MATKVFHGPPGSYKSSTAMWFEIVPALREGRVVVTNLQGIKPLEDIQRELKEVFPNTARLLRISIGNDNGLLLMRNFFHWLPIGAMIFIDEVQDVYPNDKSFKASDYDYKNECYFDDKLPQDFIELYHVEQRKIKANVDVADYQDDLGGSLFDERDYLRYPRTLRECFMRHRHYNWDILLATPDIKEIAGFVRSVCEVAYCHSSKDAIPIPYYKRRPRILEHLPKTNGTSVGKNDIVKFKKVPLDVFKLYKSTATGSSTKSGVGQSPFTFSIVFGLTCVIAYIFYMVFFFFDDSDDEVFTQVSTVAVAKEVLDKASNKEGQAASKQGFQSGEKDNLSLDDFTYRDVGVSSVIAPSNAIGLPFDAKSIYVNAVNTVYYGKHRVNRDYVFTLHIGEDVFSINSESLIGMGYKIFYKSSCLVELRSDVGSNYIYCEPKRLDSPVASNDIDGHAVKEVSLLGS
jgi:zona occludens toxin